LENKEIINKMINITIFLQSGFKNFLRFMVLRLDKRGNQLSGQSAANLLGSAKLKIGEDLASLPLEQAGGTEMLGSRATIFFFPR
jgi:hypothetical protein